MLGTVSLLLRGIPFIYQGQEIGMQNVSFGRIEDYDDISTIDQYHIAREAGLSHEEALSVCEKMSRDNARTPVQWNGEEHAGFTTGTPWLKVNPNYKKINVADQEKDENSVLHYYRKLVAARKSDAYREVFTYGEFVPVYEDSDSVMAYYRVLGEKRILAAANFGKERVEIPLEYPVKQIVLSNKAGVSSIKENLLTLQSCEVIVLQMW